MSLTRHHSLVATLWFIQSTALPGHHRPGAVSYCGGGAIKKCAMIDFRRPKSERTFAIATGAPIAPPYHATQLFISSERDFIGIQIRLLQMRFLVKFSYRISNRAFPSMDSDIPVRS